MDYSARCDELLQVFESLYAIEQPLVCRSGPVRYLTTVIRTSAFLVSLAYNVANPTRRINQQFNPGADDESFDFLLVSIYRNFITSVLIWSEQGIIEFCKQRGISVGCSLTRKWDSIVKDVAASLALDDKKKLHRLRPREHPSSADFIQAATQSLRPDRRDYWRGLF
jgi:hypothetical protein